MVIAESPALEGRVMFYWVYDIPTETFALLMSCGFVGVYWIGCFVVRPIARQFVRSSRGGSNEVIGYVLSCFSVLYGLLLGLIAVAAYQAYNQVETNTSKEATVITALYEDLAGYPEPYSQDLRGLLRDYTRNLIKYGWPAQKKGIIPESGRAPLLAFQQQLLEFQPQTPAQQIIHAETFRQLNVLIESRQARLQSVTTGIPAVMWYVVILGAIVNLIILWLFEMRFITQLFLGGLYAFFLGSMIFLIAAMDNPFRGEVSVSPDAFVTAYQIMMKD